MVPGRRPCCCPPPKSREPSRTPLRTKSRPIPDRAMEFVCTGRQGRHAEVVEVDRNTADGLHSIGVNRDTPRLCQGCQLADRLNRTGLIIGQHQGGKPRVVAECPGHSRYIGESLAVDRHSVHGKAGCFKPGHWLSDRRVFDRAGDNMPR